MNATSKQVSPSTKWSIKFLDRLSGEGVLWDGALLDPAYREYLDDEQETVVRLCLNGAEVHHEEFLSHVEAETFAEVATNWQPDPTPMDDQDFGAALKAYRAWCERNGYIYQQPGRDVSGWLGDYVSLRNGGGHLALLHVDEHGAIQVVTREDA